MEKGRLSYRGEHERATSVKSARLFFAWKFAEFLLKEAEITCDASRPFLLCVGSYLKVCRMAVPKLVSTVKTRWLG